MRSVAELHPILYSELRQRLADTLDIGELNHEQIMEIIVEMLRDLLKLKIAINSQYEILIELEDQTKQILNVQNIVDSLHLLWKEFKEAEHNQPINFDN